MGVAVLAKPQDRLVYVLVRRDEQGDLHERSGEGLLQIHDFIGRKLQVYDDQLGV